jgi:hypothetical protein
MDINNQVNVDYSSSRVTAWMHQKTAKESLELEEKIVSRLKQDFPQASARVVGPTMMMSRLALYVIPDMLKSLGVALLVITVTLTIVFRSLKMGLISMVPNILPIGFAFAYIGYMGHFVDWGMSVVAAIGIGIVVDDTVHFIMRYQRTRRQGFGAEEAIRRTFDEVFTAITFTTIIIVAGFSVFTLSSFKGNADLGFYTALIVAFALLADLFLVPPLLMLGKKIGVEAK